VDNVHNATFEQKIQKVVSVVASMVCTPLSLSLSLSLFFALSLFLSLFFSPSFSRHHYILTTHTHHALQIRFLFQVGLQPAPRRAHTYRLKSAPDSEALQSIYAAEAFVVEKIMLDTDAAMEVGEVGEDVDETAVPEDEGEGEPVFQIAASDSISVTAASLPDECARNSATAQTDKSSEPPLDGATESPAENMNMASDTDNNAEAEEGADEQQVDYEYSFVRKRYILPQPGQGSLKRNKPSYGLTNVRKLVNGQEIETKQVIHARMFQQLTKYADPTRHIVKQRRYCFLWQKQSFTVSEYVSPQNGLWILKVQTEANSQVTLPPELAKVTMQYSASLTELSAGDELAKSLHGSDQAELSAHKLSLRSAEP
jgi:hypothetical protein